MLYLVDWCEKFFFHATLLMWMCKLELGLVDLPLSCLKKRSINSFFFPLYFDSFAANTHPLSFLLSHPLSYAPFSQLIFAPSSKQLPTLIVRLAIIHTLEPLTWVVMHHLVYPFCPMFVDYSHWKIKYRETSNFI